jgi:hypothetical protein
MQVPFLNRIPSHCRLSQKNSLTAARICGAIDREVAGMENRSPDCFRGYDWFQLSAEEEWVFDINRERLPRMVVTMELYEAICTIVAPEHAGFSHEEVASAKARLKLKGNETFEEYVKLATVFGGLTPREAFSYYWKHEFWCHRQHLIKAFA